MKQLIVVCFCCFLQQNLVAQGYSKAEYFFDTDPGINNATAISLTGTSDTINFTVPVPVLALSPGFHILAIRVRNNNGDWGLHENRGFYISATTSSANIVAAEYFFDTDPGAGLGTPTPVGANGTIVNFTASIPTSLPPGFHVLAIRTKDADGTWGLFEKRGFYISATATTSNIVAGEYFFDADPGIGNGVPLTSVIPGSTINQTFSLTQTQGLSQGPHLLVIRVKDANGTWGLFEYTAMTVSGVLPITGLSFNAVKENNNVKLSWYTLTEINSSHFEIERSKNGIQFEKIAAVPAAGNSSIRKDYSYIDLVPGKNLNYYRLKQVDIDGRFIYSPLRLVRFGDDKKFMVYPALTSGTVMISGITENVLIKLFSSGGQLVRSVYVNTAVSAMDISSVAAGVYWLVIEKGGELLYSQKIIKQ